MSFSARHVFNTVRTPGSLLTPPQAHCQVLHFGVNQAGNTQVKPLHGSRSECTEPTNARGSTARGCGCQAGPQAPADENEATITLEPVELLPFQSTSKSRLTCSVIIDLSIHLIMHFPSQDQKNMEYYLLGKASKK